MVRFFSRARRINKTFYPNRSLLTRLIKSVITVWMKETMMRPCICGQTRVTNFSNRGLFVQSSFSSTATNRLTGVPGTTSVEQRARSELIVGHAGIPWFYIFAGLCHTRTHTIEESIKRRLEWVFGSARGRAISPSAGPIAVRCQGDIIFVRTPTDIPSIALFSILL